MPLPASIVKHLRTQTQLSGSLSDKKRAKTIESSNPEPSDSEGPPPQSADGEEDESHVNPQDPVMQVATQTVRSAKGLTATEKCAHFLTKFQGKTPEQVLDALSQTWQSDVYAHFTHPQIVGENNGDIIHRFVCKVHPAKHVDRKDYQDSTRNLTRHRLLCEPEETGQMQMIEAYASGTAYSPAWIRYLIAMWCTRRYRPFTIVDDPKFLAMMCMLYGKVKIPSCFTVSHNIRDIMVFTKGHVMQVLQEHPGCIHLCIDGWTSPNVFAFLGITVHWYKGEELQHIILNFIKLTASHTGLYLAEKLAECLTLDNAANNICFGHILNLVVKFDYKGHKPHPVNNEGVHGEGSVEEQELDMLNEVQRTIDRCNLADSENIGEDEENLTEGDEEANLKCRHVALQKIVHLSQLIWHNLTLCATLAEAAGDQDLNSEVLMRAV
ncbi:hypothetical protein V8D89_016080 [Ganoderma adspersum]